MLDKEAAKKYKTLTERPITGVAKKYRSPMEIFSSWGDEQADHREHGVPGRILDYARGN